jgi:SEC-C motif-containing protein
MRSRYAAYALNLPQYIIDTTHPENSHYQENKDKWMQELHDFSNNIRFDGLKILSFQDGDTQAGVTFRAYLRQGEIDSSFTEQSKFIKMDDRWFYLSGVIEADKS